MSSENQLKMENNSKYKFNLPYG